MRSILRPYRAAKVAASRRAYVAEVSANYFDRVALTFGEQKRAVHAVGRAIQEVFVFRLRLRETTPAHGHPRLTARGS